jgi:seryl-tRNA synthetase
MLDIRQIRNDPEGVKAALARRGPEEPAKVDRVLELDGRWRGLTTAAEETRAQQNRASKALRGAPTPEQREELAGLSARSKELAEQEAVVRAEREGALLSLENIPATDAADADTVVKQVGSTEKTGRDHLELAGGRIDMERGARLSGSRFAYLRGGVALLEMAVIRYAFEKLGGYGFEAVIPPVLTREEALYGTGFLPDTEQQLYEVPDDDLYLVGTSEVALASMHREEILELAELPARYAGLSSCFRREAGAGGRDTRGIFRVHQFDKVEMFCFVEPSRSAEEHERILSIEESICADLELPYRVVNIAVDDLGPSAAKKYDIEVWLPGQGQYRELTSCSNTTDFQARRLDARYRAEDGRPAHLHTLNGTAVTGSRTIVALLENGQQADGSIVLPDALVAVGAPKTLPAAA